MGQQPTKIDIAVPLNLNRCLSEDKDDDVCLVTYVHVSEKSMREFYKLCFAGETFAEAVLVGVEDMVCRQVTHEVAYDDVFR